MTIRSVALAYAVPPILGAVLSLIGIMQISEAGIIGASSIVTAAPGSAPTSNAEIAAALERVARSNDATIVRVVADRTAPTMRRAALVTSAPESDGARWLRDGYPDFTRSMTTTVRPISALDAFDPTGPYEVLGNERARRATVDALVAAGYDVTSETVPMPVRLGIADGAGSAWTLIGALGLGSIVLCLVGTIGSPRRIAVRRLHGHSLLSIVIVELSAARTALVITAAGVPTLSVGLWFYNELAFAAWLGIAAVVCCSLLLIPVVVAHTLGAILACRPQIAATLRGARPSGALLVVTQLARVPATLLLVGAVFDLTGAVAVARSGSAERDLRAAGETVQLWVTPDPRPGVGTQAYWDKIGSFTATALDDRRALLSAGIEVASGRGNDTVPALFVDQEYLELQDIRADDGSRIRADDDRISLWLPASSDIPRDTLVRTLSEWELRNAPDQLRRDIGGGRLASQEAYTYPGDSTSRSWLADAPLIVVPKPSAVFSTDQLGSWLSTGDVVFTSEESAERSIAGSEVEHEFSAVVAVGQVAAEAVRQANAAARIAAASVGSSLIITLVLATLSTLAHRRRHGRALFAGAVVGTPFIRANGSLLTVEGALLAAAAVVTYNTWWDQRPDGSGAHSVLDPVAQSSGVACAVSVIVLVIVASVSVVVISRSGRNVIRTRGNGS